jgi:hypothetical protein
LSEFKILRFVLQAKRNLPSLRADWMEKNKGLIRFCKPKEDVHNISLIRTDKASYVNSKGRLCTNGEIIFTELTFQIYYFKGIKSKKNYDGYEFKFNNVSNEVNSGEYAVGVKVKNKEEVMKSYYEKEKKSEKSD